MIFKKKKENPSFVERMKNAKNRIGRRILKFALFFFTAQFAYKMANVTWKLNNSHKPLPPKNIKKISNEPQNEVVQI
ncbi:conserved Plasmodium chabaudi protein, unknown function [Plasmodium chabaudi adami]|uniref:Uncharacterized protein n=1 Tax=Plasmodium chabaudi adami TaxID=5826 RepID=A0A1D3S5S6_PLACE|nr:conserved Plasmodium chabaudi protein, unknown function [Plasmodium chabaudi adami]